LHWKKDNSIFWGDVPVASKEKILWYAGGLNFECVQCSRCCSGPGAGFIWVKKTEIEFIAEYLKISPELLRQKYLKRFALRTTIIEHPVTRDCIFLREIQGQRKCSIYPVRPNQCRNWPFWSENLASANAWNKAAQKCTGINRGRLYSLEEIEKIRKQKKWWADGRESQDRKEGR
jgi:Fe-S-cluster containining protein